MIVVDSAPKLRGKLRSTAITRRMFSAMGFGAVLICLSACQDGVLSPKGPVGLGERAILLDALALMLTIVVPTILATIGFAWWFRASNPKALRLPTWAFSGGVEIVVWAIPLLTIMFLGGMTWIASFQLDPYKPLRSQIKPLEVQVVSLDWKWLFIYPEQQIASVNTLVAPAGAPIHFTLTSGSVMNAFFVPQLGGMIYTMNGMTTQLNLEADKPGVFPGLSSHFSGDGFPGMHFNMHAVTPAEFNAWVIAAHAIGPNLDANGYAALAKQSSNVAPFTYRAIDTNLFRAIVRQTIAPGPGPAAGDVQVSPRGEALRCWAN